VVAVEVILELAAQVVVAQVVFDNPFLILLLAVYLSQFKTTLSQLAVAEAAAHQALE
jgi:hypothetical protein